MPPDRRRRRFRRPGTGRWLTESLLSLRLELAPTVRSTLTAWMRLYGEANNVPGLATGPIETRFSRLRQQCAADILVVWTTPERWAAGEGLSLRIPSLNLEFSCELSEGHLEAHKVAQIAEDARPPDHETGAVGVMLNVDHVALPPGHASHNGTGDAGVALLEGHFSRVAGRRWGGFVEPLRAALEAEAQDDEARTRRLTQPFKGATLLRGGDEDVWKLVGVSAEAIRGGYEDGEWLEVLDAQGRSMTTGRVIRTRASEGAVEAGVRGGSDPPGAGFIRPRSRRKILDQKRALLEELGNPTGSLPHLVRLVAAPAAMPVPGQVRPERFVNPAVLRNRSQARAVALALGLEEGQALMIQGPPGTGKSTTAAEIDVQLILRDPGVRILVCSHSNHGTDNMLLKVLPFLEDAQERIARVGFYDRVAREARPYFAPADTDLGDRNIIFTTIDALALQDIAGASLYDYVILDEANRAGVLDSLLALARGKRMIMVGDAMQLQPVMSEAEAQLLAHSQSPRQNGERSGVAMAPLPGGHHVIGKSLFAWLQERRFAPGATVLLDQQNRMHPAIGDLVSRVFYGGKVRTGPAAPRRGTGLPLFPSPVTWVDTRGMRGNQESRGGGTSLFNVAEGRLVTSVVRYLATQAPQGLTIGVIAAYAEQKDLLRRMLAPIRDGISPERALEVDTVDAFEGREKDIVVLSLVRSNKRRDVGFLKLEQRLNVAVSRARRLILITGDTATLRGGYFNQLVPLAASIGQMQAAPRLIGQLAGRAQKQQRRERPRRRSEDRPTEAPRDEPLADGAESGVPPASVPVREGGEAAPGEGRRRRRRRAWERRRERLRRQDESASSVQDTEPYAGGGIFSPDDEAPAQTGQANGEVREAAPEGFGSERRVTRGPRRRPRRAQQPAPPVGGAAPHDTRAGAGLEPNETAPSPPARARRTIRSARAEPVPDLPAATRSAPPSEQTGQPRRRATRPAKAVPTPSPGAAPDAEVAPPRPRARGKKAAETTAPESTPAPRRTTRPAREAPLPDAESEPA